MHNTDLIPELLEHTEAARAAKTLEYELEIVDLRAVRVLCVLRVRERGPGSRRGQGAIWAYPVGV